MFSLLYLLRFSAWAAQIFDLVTPDLLILYVRRRLMYVKLAVMYVNLIW